MSGAVLVVCADGALRADIVRLIGPVEAREPSVAVRVAWTAASVVLIGADALPVLSTADLPRRAGVVLICRTPPSSEEWKAALSLGVERVLALPGDERMLIDCVAGPPDPGLAGRVVAVIGGSGGSGASTTAAALAGIAARMEPTVLVDGDPSSGGLDVLLGVEHQPGRRWRDLGSAEAIRDPADLAGSLPTVEGVHVLSHGFGALHRPSAPVVRAVIDALRRSFAIVVVDLPRGFDPAAELWLAAADLVLVVVTATVRAIAAAATVVRTVTEGGPQVVAALRRGDAASLSAADVETGLQVPVIGVIRTDPAITAAADRGVPPLAAGRARRRGGLAAVCGQVLERLPAAAAA